MRIVYTYQAPRDADLEREIAGDLSGRFGPVEQRDALEADDGTVTVSVDMRGVETPGEDVAALLLRDRPRIIDAAEGSFGEGA